MKNGKRQYERHVKGLTDQFNDHHQSLVNLELKLEYLKNMKQPNKKGTTKNRLNLLLQNQSLIMMQFLSDDRIPSEEIIYRQI